MSRRRFFCALRFIPQQVMRNYKAAAFESVSVDYIPLQSAEFVQQLNHRVEAIKVAGKNFLLSVVAVIAFETSGRERRSGGNRIQSCRQI